MGGNIQGRLKPRNDDEKRMAEQAGYDLSKVCPPTPKSLSMNAFRDDHLRLLASAQKLWFSTGLP